MSSNELLNIEVITPGGAVYKGQATSFQAPGISGKFQILPGHTSMLSVLKIGTLKAIVSGTEKYFSIAGGFFEIDQNNIKVLAESAEPADEIDPQRAEEAKKRALERLQKESRGEVDIKRAKAALARALNRLDALKMLKN